MTSLDTNLLERESKSSRLKVADDRDLKYASMQAVSAVLGSRSGAPTMTGDMALDFIQRLTDGRVGIEKIVVLAGIPVTQRREFLGDGRKQPNNDANRRRFHLVAELGNGCFVLVENIRFALDRTQVKILPEPGNGSQTASPPKRRAEWKQP